VQQERLVKLLHFADLELGDANTERGLSLVTVVRECLHSANFWEQENVRCEVASSGGLFRMADLGRQHHFLLFNMPEPPS